MRRFLSGSVPFLIMLSVAAPAAAQIYAGPTTSRWLTNGRHGHDQPSCGEPVCDRSDFRRSNLDDSIGFRFGVERGPFGLDFNVTHTEYNLSQKNFSIFAAQAFVTASRSLGLASAGVRAGLGPLLTTDGHAGAQGSLEGFVALPQALQFGVRYVVDATRDGRAKMLETSFLIVPLRRWDIATSTGVALTHGLHLRDAPFTRLTAGRHAYVSWTSTAHESELKSTFRGFPGNERSKTIHAFGIGGRRLVTPRLHVGAGVEIADWSDDHELLAEGGRVVRRGIAGAPSIEADWRCPVTAALAIEGGVQQLYWPRIHLSETRASVGIAFFGRR